MYFKLAGILQRRRRFVLDQKMLHAHVLSRAQDNVPVDLAVPTGTLSVGAHCQWTGRLRPFANIFHVHQTPTAAVFFE